MTTVLYLLAVQGAIGAFDTLYYHEYRARLPGRAAIGTRPELALHGVRAVFYAVLFGTLPFLEWRGAFTGALALILAAEIVITLCDFAIEDRVRAPFGGVEAGERVTHAVMGIVYGAMLAHFWPHLAKWWAEPTALSWSPATPPATLRFVLLTMAGGVFLSGVRDLAVAAGARAVSWPWRWEEGTT